ncbi:SGNH/GDSL hydrolase family protein [Cohnella sp. REN36]|uniref:SGNH/GDSL hydrolase family protein n=1 Tax=Cohnella sp. REN36 TaxID=2887347 RepID=UPI001D14E558|nr:SGNH/GDSL hydrolase family protein [Cohnella sp. REN36]MCC3373972.1 SGNH/GDSL hydrolase family protein [Cohnella sp. REN36]
MLPMAEGIVRRRGGLARTKRKLKEGALTIGFIGGSITDARPGHNWPEPVTRWLAEAYPDVRFFVENAGIGATGSDLAAFRAKRDLIDTGCDLVFVEFAVNDYDTPPERRNRTREGLLRQLLADGRRDVVLVYTYCQPMYEAMMRGDAPHSIAEFEALGEHYGLSSVWMGKYALEEVKRGRMRWEEWLPDGLHPTERGSLSYGESVIGFLRETLRADAAADLAEDAAERPLPAPLHEGHWQRVRFVPFEDVRTEGPWTVRRWVTLHWIDRALSTSAVGAKLRFSFEGRGLALGFDFGNLSAEFRWRIDGGEWMRSVRERPDWCGPQGWFKLETLAEDLPEGRHEAEIEVVHGNAPDCAGTRFDLAFIGIL